MSATFAPARLEDVDAVAGLMEHFYRLEHLAYDEAAAREALRVLIASPGSGRVFLIRAADEALAGYMVLTFGFSLEFRGRFALLDELYVRDAFRRRGIGRAALRFAEALCREDGIGALRLEVDRANGPALALYRSSGFEDQGRDFLTRRLANPRAHECN